MRAQYDFNEWGNNFRTSTQQLPQTPRGGASRPNIPIDTSRRSTTPSRIQDRVSNSPLKAPLEKAINKAVRGRQNDIERSTQSRYLGKSSKRDESPIVSMARKIYYDEDPQTQQLKAHPQTFNFVKKYFDSMNQQVPIQRFIQKIMQQYETLWGTQNADKIFDDFTYKISDIFNHDYIDLRQLVRITKQDGMIGLILRIFKQIKSEQNTRSSGYVSFTQNPQVVNISRSFQEKLAQNESVVGIKNVVQQFMESMYQAMESQIYEKFNIQMRRMIVKYRQAEKLLKKVNQKLNNYADVFDFDSKLREKEKKYETMIDQLTKQKEKAVKDLQKQKQFALIQKRQKDKISQQVLKLKETLQKYQNTLLNKVMQNNSTDQSSFKQVSSQSRINERPSCQPLRTSQINNGQPFKITIDTHVVHKQNMPPETKTITTFHPLPPVNPVNSNQRQSYQNRPPTNYMPPPSPFTASRVTTYRPLSPTPLSPYHSRIIRPL